MATHKVGDGKLVGVLKFTRHIHISIHTRDVKRTSCHLKSILGYGKSIVAKFEHIGGCAGVIVNSIDHLAYLGDAGGSRGSRGHFTIHKAANHGYIGKRMSSGIIHPRVALRAQLHRTAADFQRAMGGVDSFKGGCYIMIDAIIIVCMNGCHTELCRIGIFHSNRIIVVHHHLNTIFGAKTINCIGRTATIAVISRNFHFHTHSGIGFAARRSISHRHAIIHLIEVGTTHHKDTVLHHNQGTIHFGGVVVVRVSSKPIDGENIVAGARIISGTESCNIVAHRFAHHEAIARYSYATDSSIVRMERHGIGGGEGHLALVDDDVAVARDDVVLAGHILHAAHHLIVGHGVQIYTGIAQRGAIHRGGQHIAIGQSLAMAGSDGIGRAAADLQNVALGIHRHPVVLLGGVESRNHVGFVVLHQRGVELFRTVIVIPNGNMVIAVVETLHTVMVRRVRNVVTATRTRTTPCHPVGRETAGEGDLEHTVHTTVASAGDRVERSHKRYCLFHGYTAGHRTGVGYIHSIRHRNHVFIVW